MEAEAAANPKPRSAKMITVAAQQGGATTTTQGEEGGATTPDTQNEEGCDGARRLQGGCSSREEEN